MGHERAFYKQYVQRKTSQSTNSTKYMTNTDCSQIAIHFSKDCGRGTVAIKSLEAGDTILREKPLLTVVLLDGADTAEISRLVIEGYDNMDLMRKQLYDQLHASERQTKYLAERMPDMDCKDETLATLSRFDTNCFLLYYEGQSIHKDGIFYRSSFFNHSCTPNANWSWCHEKNELVIIATTPIEPGDEITIGYIDCLFHSRDQRQAACKRLGFVCRCSVCAQAIDPLTRRKLAKWIERYDENADLHSPQSLKCFDMIEYYALKSGLRNDELAWW